MGDSCDTKGPDDDPIIEPEEDDDYDPGQVRCDCAEEVADLCEYKCVDDNVYICASKSNARWGGGTYVTKKFKVEKNSKPKQCRKMIKQSGCALKTDDICKNEGTIIESKCSCPHQMAQFHEAECVDENTYICTRSDGETAKFTTKDCEWIDKNEMDCASNTRPFCPRWGGGGNGGGNCVETAPTPKCSCGEEIKRFERIECIDTNTYVCYTSKNKQIVFEVNPTQCLWLEFNKMNCATKPRCKCDVSKFASVECINDDQYTCKRQDGQLAKFSGEDCEWIRQNKMNCKLSPGPARCNCDEVYELFEDVKCS